MYNEKNNEELLIIRNKFLSCVPIADIALTDHLDSIPWTDQAFLLAETVKNPLLRKYPLKTSYQLAFLKALINTLERSCAEVHDSLYDTYCSLLNFEDHSKYSYKHYCVNDIFITLKENKNFISEGTTGLCSWQASLALSEWCLINQALLQGKTILELGSGVGLVGITVALHCQPNSVYLTDCHPKVLEVLSENVSINLSSDCTTNHSDTSDNKCLKDYSKSSANSGSNRHFDSFDFNTTLQTLSAGSGSFGIARESFDCSTIHGTFSAGLDKCASTNTTLPKSSTSNSFTSKQIDYSSGTNHKSSDKQIQPHQSIVKQETCKQLDSSDVSRASVRSNTKVFVLNLPWEKVKDIEKSGCIKPDLILAADVVYDNSVFEPLCSAVQWFLDLNPKCMVIFACTVRNQATLQEFIKLLGKFLYGVPLEGKPLQSLPLIVGVLRVNSMFEEWREC